MPIEMDFSALRGRIIEKFGTFAAFAQAIGMSRASLSQRVMNDIAFKPDEIILICSPEVLDIPSAEIGKYFFTPKV